MNYTIQKLAELMGTTARTVRFYDQIGLLKPAFIAENGYRYYTDQQVVRLQQILFFKDLGCELKHIQELFSTPNFDTEKMFLEQKRVIEKNIKKQKKLLKTVEMMLLNIEKARTMTAEQMTQEIADKLELQVNSILGEGEQLPAAVQAKIELKEKLAQWSWAEDWTPFLSKSKKIMAEFEKLLDAGVPVDSPDVQLLARENFELGKRMMDQTKESILKNGLVLRDKSFAESLNISSELGCYIADAMDYFANKNL